MTLVPETALEVFANSTQLVPSALLSPESGVSVAHLMFKVQLHWGTLFVLWIRL